MFPLFSQLVSLYTVLKKILFILWEKLSGQDPVPKPPCAASLIWGVFNQSPVLKKNIHATTLIIFNRFLMPCSAFPPIPLSG